VRVIILAAGQGFLLDGMVKCLVRAPHDSRPLLEKAIEAFAGHKITVVVGYRAVSIMEVFPELDYVYNPDWGTSNNSLSLGLALNDEPTYVLSSDLVFERDIVEELEAAGPNLVLTERRENRILSSINCATDGASVREFYVGPLRTPADPEAVGMFKISDRTLLRQWKRNCLKHGNLFVGQNLPVGSGEVDVRTHDLGSHLFYEINNPADYLRALRVYRGARTAA
jgi:choline kinase